MYMGKKVEKEEYEMKWLKRVGVEWCGLIARGEIKGCYLHSYTLCRVGGSAHCVWAFDLSP